MRGPCVVVLAALAVLTGCGSGTETPLEQAVEIQDVLDGRVDSGDGLSIAYSAVGRGDTALVLIHGWMCDRTFWEAQVEAFRDSYRVVTVDLGGHGQSGSDRAYWTFAALAGDVQAVIEAEGLARVILVGHSMGGPVALEAARLMPSKVTGVIGVDTLQDADFAYDKERTESWIRQYEQNFAGTCDRFVRSMFHENSDPGLIESTVEKMCAGNPEIAVPLLDYYTHYDLGAALAAVQVPVRAINTNRFAETRVENNRKYNPDFDAVIVDAVGHFLHMEKPAVFNANLQTVIEGL